MVEGSGKFVKFLMLVINFALLITGITIIGFGIWTLVDKTFFEYIIGTNRYFISASILFIVIGVLSSFISVVGFCGAYQEKRFLLISYFAFLFIIFCLIISSIVLAYIFRSEMDERMTTEMFNTMKNYGEDNNLKITNSWDLVQKNFKCCGVGMNSENSNELPYKAWKTNKLFVDGNDKPQVPSSCCKNPDDKDCNLGSKIENSESSIYKDDCFLKIKFYIKEHSVLLGSIAIFISVLLLIAMTLSCSLFCMIKH